MATRLRLLFLVLGLAFMAGAAAHALADEALALPSAAVLLAAGAFALTGLLAATAAWVALGDGRAPARRLAAGFLAAQVGKYIPGGVWSGVGQVGFGVGAGLSVGTAAGALVAYGVSLVAAAGVLVATTTPWATGVPGWLGATCLVLPLLVARRWIAAAVRIAASVLPARLPTPVIPDQRTILRCALHLVPALAGSALSFVVLLGAAGGDLPVASVVCAFSVAWLTGFLALGLPSGLGAREAVLVLLLDAGTAPVLAASVAHRLVQAAVEGLLLLVLRRHLGAASPAASSSSAPAPGRVA